MTALLSENPSRRFRVIATGGRGMIPALETGEGENVA